MTIQLGLKVITTKQQMADDICKAVSIELNIKVVKILPKLESEFQNLIRQSIENSQEYSELVGAGRLRTELGIEDDPTGVLQNVIQLLISNLKVKFEPVKSYRTHIFGSIKLFIDTDIQHIISHSGGEYRTKKGTKIPWLEWLLTLGDQIIIQEYDVVRFRPAYSRTGDAIMVKSVGGGWRVPPQFSGVEDNNFITRAIESVIPTFEKTLENEIKTI